MKLKNTLHKIDQGLIMVDTALYGPKLTVSHDLTITNTFTITQSTMNKIFEFRKDYPDISPELFDQELNATIVEMLFRMERECNGSM